jgi:hypothetical protein
MTEHPDDPFDKMARENPDIADAIDELRQHARELASESDNFEEFAEMFGLSNVCERCGRQGLNDEDYTDCDLVPDDDPQGPEHLVCLACLRALNGPTDDG